MKILVIKPTALGDVAQALLVVTQLKKFSDEVELVWLIDEDYRELIEAAPLVDRLILFPRRRWKKSFSTFLKEIIPWSYSLKKENFDLVLDLQGLARSGWMTWVTRAPRRVGLASAREGSSLAYTEVVQDSAPHAVDRYKQAIEHVIGGAREVSLDYLPKINRALPHDLVSHQYTLIHPYSLWLTKLWPWENYTTLVQSMPEEKFVLIGKGPFFPLNESNVVDLRNNTTLAELLLLLSHAKVVLSLDSGPLHVAAVLGTPVVALYGATSEKLTGSRARSQIILTAEIPCRPCLKRTCSWSEPMECLQSLLPTAVRIACSNLATMSKNRHERN